ncbi:MAG: sigma-70 family RNA polymerase sigma factor [Anaerohalosphaera sp.]|nr:sigma-70 family RNA polymerase sigma factor [Anaerohalosphaera sp.]
MKSKKFMSLLVPNQRRIHAYILYLVPNSSDADDILQETLAEMWNKFESFEEGSNFIAWSLTVAKYKILSFRQKNKKTKVLFSDHLNDLLEKESADALSYVQQELEALKQCMAKLSGKQKSYILMRYEQGLTFREIASQVGISMQAVYKSVCRIHVSLAKCVQFSLRLEGRS